MIILKILAFSKNRGICFQYLCTYSSCVHDVPSGKQLNSGHTPFFKKDATFCRSTLFLSHLLKRCKFITGLSPPGYLPGYLMLPILTNLPDLTNQFIKLSDGDVQCE